MRALLVGNGMEKTKATDLARVLAEGRWTHDYPITAETAAGLGLPISTELPNEVREIIQLYPQPRGRRPSGRVHPRPLRSTPGTCRTHPPGLTRRTGAGERFGTDYRGRHRETVSVVDRNFYQFRSEWHLSAPPDDVFRALAELGDYPAWWPEVRTVRRLSDDTCQLTCRSLLPYDLEFTVQKSRSDRQAGILEARLNGDLAGFARWTIVASSGGTLAVFDEEVVVNKGLLRRLALIARPAFKSNHALMMSHGWQGLSAYLAGMRLGREPETPDI